MLNRGLSEREIERARKAVQERLTPILEFQGGEAFVPKASLLAATETRAIIRCGTIRPAWRRHSRVRFTIPIVAKTEIRRAWHGEFKDSHLRLAHKITTSIAEEQKAEFLRRLKFPVPFHHAVGEVAPYTYLTVAEDLSTGGHKLKEAFGFDFSSLKNGIQLEKKLSGLVEELLEMERQGVLKLDKHKELENSEKALRKCFGVRFKRPGGKGELVMHDLDNFILQELDDASARRIQNFAKVSSSTSTAKNVGRFVNLPKPLPTK